MTDPVDAALLELQREYLRSMPKKLDELRSRIAALGSGAPESEQSLRDGLHRLAGSGGSFGFSELSGIAREGERWLAANPGSTDTTGLSSLLERLGAAVSRAETQLAGVAAGEKPSLTPRALLIMRASQQRERIAQELRNAGYELRFGERQEDPASIPTERLPHLVIIGGEAGDGDLSAVASRWTSSPDRRPGAVVLVETGKYKDAVADAEAALAIANGGTLPAGNSSNLRGFALAAMSAAQGRMGDAAGAERSAAALQQASSAAPNDPGLKSDVHLAQGMLALAKKDPKGAAAHFEMCSQQDSYCHWQAYEVARAAGDKAAAASALARLTKIYRRDPLALYARSTVARTTPKGTN